MKLRWARIALVLGAALFIGSILTLELYFNSRATGVAVDLLDIAIPQFVRAGLWAALAPLILQLRAKVPLRRGHGVGGVAFHLAASFVVMATYYLGRMWSYSWWYATPGADGFWTAALQNFYGRNLIDMVYYWGVLALGYGIEMSHRLRNEELKAAQLETELAETELKALRQQLHPHFLFNTLNTIAVLVRESRPDQAVALISRLGALLRQALDQTGVAEVTLQQEIDFLDNYLEIQRARFSDQLTVTFDIAPETRRARIPNLLLQPLVENALVHGIAPKTTPGHLGIVARTERGELLLEVRDDGPGLTNATARAKEGVGLNNTRARLAKLYGPKAQLSLQSQAGRGMCVQIVLPYQT